MQNETSSHSNSTDLFWRFYLEPISLCPVAMFYLARKSWWPLSCCCFLHRHSDWLSCLGDWQPSWWPLLCFLQRMLLVTFWLAEVIGRAAPNPYKKRNVSQSHLVGLCTRHGNDAANSFGDGFLWHNVELPNMSWATQVSAEIPSSGEWQMWYAASSLSALMDYCLGKGDDNTNWCTTDWGKGGGGRRIKQTDALPIGERGGGEDKTNWCTTDWGKGGGGEDKTNWCTTDWGWGRGGGGYNKLMHYWLGMGDGGGGGGRIQQTDALLIGDGGGEGEDTTNWCTTDWGWGRGGGGYNKLMHYWLGMGEGRGRIQQTDALLIGEGGRGRIEQTNALLFGDGGRWRGVIKQTDALLITEGWRGRGVIKQTDALLITEGGGGW